MNCNHARLLLPFAGEIDAAAAEALREHLELCPDCADFADDEMRGDQALAQAMRAVPLPAGLKGRIAQRLHTRAIRRWASVAAVAAALFLTAGVLWFVLTQPSAVPWSEFVAFHQAGSTPEELEQVFDEQHGLRMRAPRQFRYDFLESYHVVRVQGQNVPQLTFVSQNEGRPVVAHVYVLNDRQFSLQDEVATKFSTSTHTVETLPGPGGLLYVIFYTGGSLAPFLQPGV